MPVTTISNQMIFKCLSNRPSLNDRRIPAIDRVTSKELTQSNGSSSRGDGVSYDLSVATGFKSNKSQVNFAVGYQNQDLIKTSSRNAWYCETARNEIEQLKGPLYEGAVAKLGREFVDHNIAIWANMLPVLHSGEHCPTHLRAQRPVAL